MEWRRSVHSSSIPLLLHPLPPPPALLLLLQLHGGGGAGEGGGGGEGRGGGEEEGELRRSGIKEEWTGGGAEWRRSGMGEDCFHWFSLFRQLQLQEEEEQEEEDVGEEKKEGRRRRRG